MPERGWCPVCERYMNLNKDGTLRHHGGPEGSGRSALRNRAYRCKGASELPSVAPKEGR